MDIEGTNLFCDTGIVQISKKDRDGEAMEEVASLS